MNELTKQEVMTEVVVADPFDATKFHKAVDTDSMIASGRNRVAQWREKVAGLGELAANPVSVLKAIKSGIDDDDKALTSFADRYAKGVIEYLGLTDKVRALAVQIKGTGRIVDPLSIRGGLKELSAKLGEVIKQMTPPKPTHTYVIKVTCTDAALDKIVKTATKEDATDICWAAAQSDKAAKQIDKWFEENV